MIGRRIAGVGALVVASAVFAIGAKAGTGPSDPLAAGFEELAEVAPIPAGIRSDGTMIERELASRVDSWMSRTGAYELRDDEVAEWMLHLWRIDLPGSSLTDPRYAGIPADDEWLVERELLARLHALCLELGSDHPMRQEFCPSSTA